MVNLRGRGNILIGIGSRLELGRELLRYCDLEKTQSHRT